MNKKEKIGFMIFIMISIVAIIFGFWSFKGIQFEIECSSYCNKFEELSDDYWNERISLDAHSDSKNKDCVCVNKNNEESCLVHIREDGGWTTYRNDTYEDNINNIERLSCPIIGGYFR